MSLTELDTLKTAQYTLALLDNDAKPAHRYEGMSPADAILAERLRQTVPGILWLLHCGIEAAQKYAQSPRDLDSVQVALVVAHGILGDTPSQTLELRAELMEKAKLITQTKGTK